VSSVGTKWDARWNGNRRRGSSDGRQRVDAGARRLATPSADALHRGRIVDDFAWSRDAARLAVARSAATNDKRAETHEAFLSLGCALICWRSLRRRWLTE
jgi:hypothetical protein